MTSELNWFALIFFLKIGSGRMGGGGKSYWPRERGLT